MMQTLPPLAAVQFGNEIIANYDGNTAALLGNYSPEQNYQIAGAFPFEDVFGAWSAQFDPNITAQMDPGPQPEISAGVGALTQDTPLKLFGRTIAVYVLALVVVGIALTALLAPEIRKVYT